MRKYIIDNDRDLIPAGTYSISFRTYWQHPFVGRNGFDHHVVRINAPTSMTNLKNWLALFVSRDHEPKGKCLRANITAICRLDIGLTIQSGSDIME